MRSKMSSMNRPGKNWQSNSGWIHMSLCQTTWMTGESYHKEKDLVGKSLWGINNHRYHAIWEQVFKPFIKDVRTPHEEAVFLTSNLWNLSMLSHTLLSFLLWIPSPEIEDFRMVNTNPFLQGRRNHQRNLSHGTPIEKKVASVFLRDLPLYLVLFTPLYYLGNNKLANVAEIISWSFGTNQFTEPISATSSNLDLTNLPEEEQEKLKRMDVWPCSILYEKMKEGYTEPLWQCGLDRGSQDLPSFYNANKALMNLGQDPSFQTQRMTSTQSLWTESQPVHLTTTSSLSKSEMVTFSR